MPGDCCECGACCFSESDAYVPVTESDMSRLGELAASATVLVQDKRYLRMQSGRCAQLQYAEGDWVCGIYSIRPSTCRELKRGSPPCLAERELKLVKVRRLSRDLEAVALKK